MATVGIRQAVPYALYYGGAAVLLMFPTLIVALLNTFGRRDSVYYPVFYIVNALIGWLAALWLASVWAQRHRRRLEAELRRPE